jgi:CDP-diacylglycerol pyrophosphatase
MHYDVTTGVQASRGLFSVRAVLILLIVLVSAGAYLAVTWFAPDIMIKSTNDKRQVEEAAMTTNPEKGRNALYIPALAIQLPISDKLVESGIWTVKSGGKLTLAGKYKVFGITPFETVRLSPFYCIGQLVTDDKIYVDMDGVRTVYQVADGAEDLVLQAVDSENSNDAKTTVRAKNIGTVEIRDGQAVIRPAAR